MPSDSAKIAAYEKDYDKREPVCREKWAENVFREFDCKEDKREIHRLMCKMGLAFQQDFRTRRDELKRGGMSLAESYRTAIRELAENIPTRAQLAANGTFGKYERMKRARKTYKEKRVLAVTKGLTRVELHRELRGKKSTVLEDVEFVADHLSPDLDILGLDPDEIPSRSALNMLVWANSNPDKYWSDNVKERLRIESARRGALADNGQDDKALMYELIRAGREIEEKGFAQSPLPTETADVAGN